MTFKFDKPVTDPVLDLSGLGGNCFSGATYYYDEVDYYGNRKTTGPWLIARGSFNSTDLDLITPGISMERATGNSNLVVEGNTIKVAKRNTYTRAETDFDYLQIRYKDDYSGRYWDVKSPTLEPAGSGSINLKGTFDEVSFKLYHVATPYSAFPAAQYGTDPIYSWKSSWGPQYGDGVNGMNILISESYLNASEWVSGN